MEHAPDPSAREAYRLSLEGWRALEQHDVGAARRLLDRAVALAPQDPVVHYRRGCVSVAEQRPDEALESFGRVIASHPAAPPVFVARAYLDRGLLLEARHDETGAIDAWRSAAHVFGADAATRARAQRAIARVTTRDRSIVPPR